MAGHTCHALGCERQVPPRMHMCKPHWAMVPKDKQSALWAAYQPGQERRMDPSPDYLRAAARCIRAVAQQENHTPEAINDELEPYLSWAEMIEADA